MLELHACKRPIPGVPCSPLPRRLGGRCEGAKGQVLLLSFCQMGEVPSQSGEVPSTSAPAAPWMFSYSDLTLDQGRTALGLAAAKGDEDLVDELIEDGACADERDEFEETPLRGSGASHVLHAPCSNHAAFRAPWPEGPRAHMALPLHALPNAHEHSMRLVRHGDPWSSALEP